MKKILKALTLVLFVNLFALSAFCAKPAVEDRVNYSKKVVSAEYLEYMDFGYHKIQIPKLTYNTNVAQKINQEIYDSCKDYYEALLNNTENNQIYDIQYSFKDENGIIGLFVEKNRCVQAGGGSFVYKAFYYDANRDKKLSLNEYLYLLGVSLNDIQKKINEQLSAENLYLNFYANVEDVIIDSNECIAYIESNLDIGDHIVKT